MSDKYSRLLTPTTGYRYNHETQLNEIIDMETGETTFSWTEKRKLPRAAYKEQSGETPKATFVCPVCKRRFIEKFGYLVRTEDSGDIFMADAACIKTFHLILIPEESGRMPNLR